ncbi:DUF423 domain-containing protein [Rosenbergiella australiborealis]|uniref:DUF423 domain-containing protein n=1 Tax=Rosenbergiella australiborealis TaxID=1544696 RepID=UPI001F4DA06B|nr:DUF423 domain-containing protein [Rosenbergiella australiborealis]
MSSRMIYIFVAISGFFLVAFGAFGAHVLSHMLSSEQLAWIHTGLQYQAWHTLAILGLGTAMQTRCNIWFYWSTASMALGIVLFSGSLYSLALSHLHFLVFITPIGGMFFLIGWLLMLIGALRLRNRASRHE